MTKLAKAYNKTQLAQLYGIDARKLNKWINEDKELLYKLKSIGFDENKRGPHIFKQSELIIIYHHLGIPGEAANLDSFDK